MWKLIAEPRTVDVHFTKEVEVGSEFDRDAGWCITRETYVASRTQIPAIVQVCREARQSGVYRQLFSELKDVVYHGGRDRYLWLNLEVDMIDIGSACLTGFIPVLDSIQRLKITWDDRWVGNVLCLGDCINLKELHVAIMEPVTINIRELFKSYPLFCGVESISMVDSQLGLVPLTEYVFGDIEDTDVLVDEITEILERLGFQWRL